VGELRCVKSRPRAGKIARTAKASRTSIDTFMRELPPDYLDGVTVEL
jgi:hypothetical protein